MNDGRFHCLKCGRKHNRSSTIGSFHHSRLDTERDNLSPEEVAVGISFVKATKKDYRKAPRATSDEVNEEFNNHGFNEQFPNVNVEEQLREWKEMKLVGDERHTGKHWYVFLANRYEPAESSVSPKHFHSLMKQYRQALDSCRER